MLLVIFYEIYNLDDLKKFGSSLYMLCYLLEKNLIKIVDFIYIK